MNLVKNRKLKRKNFVLVSSYVSYNPISMLLLLKRCLTLCAISFLLQKLRQTSTLLMTKVEQC